MVVYNFNPSAQETEAGRALRVKGRCGLHRETLSLKKDRLEILSHALTRFIKKWAHAVGVPAFTQLPVFHHYHLLGHPCCVKRFMSPQHASEDQRTTWRSQFSLPMCVLGIKTQVASPGGKHLYLLSHLTSPINPPSQQGFANLANTM